MKERDARIDRLFKGYYKSKQSEGEAHLDSCEELSLNQLYSKKHVLYDLPAEKEPCPDLATLGAYIEGSLGKEEQALITSHIRQCNECREKIEPASTTLNEMREGRLEKTPDDLSSDTSSRISDSTRKTPPKE